MLAFPSTPPKERRVPRQDNKMLVLEKPACMSHGVAGSFKIGFSPAKSPDNRVVVAARYLVYGVGASAEREVIAIGGLCP